MSSAKPAADTLTSQLTPLVGPQAGGTLNVAEGVATKSPPSVAHWLEAKVANRHVASLVCGAVDSGTKTDVPAPAVQALVTRCTLTEASAMFLSFSVWKRSVALVGVHAHRPATSNLTSVRMLSAAPFRLPLRPR